MSTQRCVVLVLYAAGCGRLEFRALSDGGAALDARTFEESVLQTAGLIAYWPFDGDMRDLGPYGQHAVAAGATPSAVTFCPGLGDGQGVHVENRSGENSFVEVPAPIGGVFDSAELTLLLWVRPDQLAAPASTVPWNSLFDRNSLWYTELFSADDGAGGAVGQYVVRLYDATTPSSGGTGRIGEAPAMPVNLPPAEWHMFALTYDGATVTPYVNGQPLLSLPYTGALGPTAETPAPPWGNYNLTWGAWEQRDDWSTACFDDTAYFGRGLSAQEIAELHAAKLSSAR